MICVISSLDVMRSIGLPKVNDGSTETVDDDHVVTVFTQGNGGVEVIDQSGRRVGIVGPWEHGCFRAATSQVNSSAEFTDIRSPLWVYQELADWGDDAAGGASAIRGPSPTSGAVSFSNAAKIEATTSGLSCYLSTDLASGASWSCNVSCVNAAVDAWVTSFIGQHCDAWTSILQEVEMEVNRLWAAVAQAGVLSVGGYAGVGTSVHTLSSQTSDYYPLPWGPTNRYSTWLSTVVDYESSRLSVNKLGIVSPFTTDNYHVTGALDFTVAVALPEIGTSLATSDDPQDSSKGSSSPLTSGNHLTITNTGTAPIEVYDDELHKICEVEPEKGIAHFVAISSNFGWKHMKNINLVLGAESLAGTSVKSSDDWGSTNVYEPMDLQSRGAVFSISCMTTALSSFPATYASQDISCAFATAAENGFRELTCQLNNVASAINANVNALMDALEMVDIIAWTS
jgi:hypothetical protein